MKLNFKGRHFGVLPEISSGSSGKILYFFVFYQLTKFVYCIKKCRIFLCRPCTICNDPERADFYVMVVNTDYYESRCSKCPPAALIHACSLFLNTRTAFLMDSCVKSFQIAFRA